MTDTKSASWKNCVTCECWTGSRNISESGDRVEYSGDQEEGVCMGGGWNRTQKTAMSSCGQWRKWSLLSSQR